MQALSDYDRFVTRVNDLARGAPNRGIIIEYGLHDEISAQMQQDFHEKYCLQILHLSLGPIDEEKTILELILRFVTAKELDTFDYYRYDIPYRISTQRDQPLTIEKLWKFFNVDRRLETQRDKIAYSILGGDKTLRANKDGVEVDILADGSWENLVKKYAMEQFFIPLVNQKLFT